MRRCNPAGPRRAAHLKHLILLGHPKSKLADGVPQAADRLVQEMQSERHRDWPSWQDGWCDPDKEAAPRPGALLGAAAVGGRRASAMSNSQGARRDTCRWGLAEKSKPALEKSRIMLWLPKGEQHEGPLANWAETDGDANPAFRTDGPSELSHSWRACLGGTSAARY